MTSAPLRIGWHTERPTCREEAEVRVLRALATMRTPGVVVGATQAARVMWPAYVHDEQDLKWQRELVSEDDPVDLFRPSRRDLSDWLYALAWFAAIPRAADLHPGREPWSLTLTQKIVRWRSFGLGDDDPPSWEFIAGRYGRPRRWAQVEYQRGIDRVWQAARVWRPGDGVVKANGGGDEGLRGTG